MPKLYGIEHITYLITAFVLGVAIFFLCKRLCKTEKQQEIMFRVLGAVGLTCIIINRIFLAYIKYRYNLWWLIPDSFCGMTSLMLSISLLFFRKDNYLLHGVWLLCIVGMTITNFYPDFIGQNESFFYLPTISGLLHHTVSLFNIIMVFAFKYVHLTYKKSWVQPILIGTYLLTGVFLIYVARFSDAYYFFKPAVPGTPLYMWLMLILYTVVYALIMLIIELVRRHKKPKTEEQHQQ